MGFDWMLFFTAVMAIAAIAVPVASFIGWVMNKARKADWEIIKGMKADSDFKIDNLKDMQEQTTQKLTGVYTDLQAKLDKRDHELALERIDKEISDLRVDSKAGRAEILRDIKDMRIEQAQALKDLRNDLVTAIRDATRN